eukprot:2642-Heterococcus_DN1.PRE.3
MSVAINRGAVALMFPRLSECCMYSCVQQCCVVTISAHIAEPPHFNCSTRSTFVHGKVCVLEHHCFSRTSAEYSKPTATQLNAATGTTALLIRCASLMLALSGLKLHRAYRLDADSFHLH